MIINKLPKTKVLRRTLTLNTFFQKGYFHMRSYFRKQHNTGKKKNKNTNTYRNRGI